MVRLRFLPLLLGRIEIADVAAARPTITVVFNSDRQLELVGPCRHPGARLTGRAEAGRRHFRKSELERHRHTARRIHKSRRDALTNVELSLAWPSISKSFAATGRFVWHKETIDATISFTDFMSALQGERSGLKVRLASAPLKFAFDGIISHRPTFKWKARSPPTPHRFATPCAGPAQSPSPGGGFNRFALKAQDQCRRRQ